MESLSLTWFGHAAFLLESGGVRVLLDPYRTPDVGGYAPINTEADLVVVSHLNPKYHSHWEAATGHPTRLNGLDFAGTEAGVRAHGIHFRALPAWESAKRDVAVSMPFFTLGGVTLCHSGDLGAGLTAEEIAPIQGVDIFLAVAGGPPTLPIGEMKAAIDLIQPRIVIPMHFGNDKVNLNLQPLSDFLSLWDPEQIVHHPTPTLDLSPAMLPPELRVLVLPPAR